jgi:hypothetical protein
MSHQFLNGFDGRVAHHEMTRERMTKHVPSDVTEPCPFVRVAPQNRFSLSSRHCGNTRWQAHDDKIRFGIHTRSEIQSTRACAKAAQRLEAATEGEMTAPAV